MRIMKLVVAGLMLVTMLVLALQNLGVVELQFLAWRLGLPIAVPVLGGYLLGAWTGRKLFRFLNRSRKELHRNLPIRTDVSKADKLKNRSAA